MCLPKIKEKENFHPCFADSSFTRSPFRTHSQSFCRDFGGKLAQCCLLDVSWKMSISDTNDNWRENVPFILYLVFIFINFVWNLLLTFILLHQGHLKWSSCKSSQVCLYSGPHPQRQRIIFSSSLVHRHASLTRSFALHLAPTSLAAGASEALALPQTLSHVPCLAVPHRRPSSLFSILTVTATPRMPEG